MSSPPLKVVVFDDSPTVRSVVKYLFTSAGHQLETAKDVDELRACFERATPTLVLVDVMTPQVFGYDLIGYLRGVSGPGVLLVLFSALSEAKLAEHVASSGADAFIHKENGFPGLVEQVEALCAARRAGPKPTGA